MFPEEVQAFRCRECSRLHAQKAEAAQCCVCAKCQKITAMTLCIECQSAAYYDREKKRLAAAPLVQTGEVFYSEDADCYFFNEDEILEYFEELLPERLWVCEPMEFHLDFDAMLESALSEHHEEADANITTKDVETIKAYLQTFVEKWNIRSWQPGSHAILVKELFTDEDQETQSPSTPEDDGREAGSPSDPSGAD